MREWRTVDHRRRCGGCGRMIPAGEPTLQISGGKFPTRRALIRCQDCTSQPTSPWPADVDDVKPATGRPEDPSVVIWPTFQPYVTAKPRPLPFDGKAAASNEGQT